MNDNKDKYIKLRELKLLQGSVLALKNQMNDMYKQIKEVSVKQYKYTEATDEEKKIMNDINNMIEEINDTWNSRIY
ncbi:MAG: hypothetical protein J6D47_04505 [Peptostreptococcaceae bacterium]|nr:hypothetical protein [Peptostreptococcaceae bacterium]